MTRATPRPANLAHLAHLAHLAFHHTLANSSAPQQFRLLPALLIAAAFPHTSLCAHPHHDDAAWDLRRDPGAPVTFVRRGRDRHAGALRAPAPAPPVQHHTLAPAAAVPAASGWWWGSAVTAAPTTPSTVAPTAAPAAGGGWWWWSSQQHDVGRNSGGRLSTAAIAGIVAAAAVVGCAAIGSALRCPIDAPHRCVRRMCSDRHSAAEARSAQSWAPARLRRRALTR